MEKCACTPLYLKLIVRLAWVWHVCADIVLKVWKIMLGMDESWIIIYRQLWWGAVEILGFFSKGEHNQGKLNPEKMMLMNGLQSFLGNLLIFNGGEEGWTQFVMFVMLCLPILRTTPWSNTYITYITSRNCIIVDRISASGLHQGHPPLSPLKSSTGSHHTCYCLWRCVVDLQGS